MLNRDFLFEQLAAMATAMRAQRPRTVKYATRVIGCPFDGKRSTVADIAADIIARRVNGDSFGMIACALNRQGVTGRNGSRWYPASVRAYYKKVHAGS